MEVMPIDPNSQVTWVGVTSQAGPRASVKIEGDTYVALLISPSIELPTPTPTGPPTPTPIPIPLPMQKIYDALRIEDFTITKPSYTQGEAVNVTYRLVNRSNQTLTVPLNRDYFRPLYLVGVEQAWSMPTTPPWPPMKLA